jgi:hypothetical protein
MDILRNQVLLWIGVGSSAVTMLILAVLAPDKVRAAFVRLWRWLPALLLVATVVVFLFVLPRWYEPLKLLDGSALPTPIRRQYWRLVLAALLITAASTFWLRRALGVSRPGWETGGPLDETWRSMLTQLGKARVDLAGQRVHVLLVPADADQARVGALARSAGLRVATEAPDGPAPVRASVVPRGVLLTCDGGWASGLTGEGTERVDDLGRKLRAWGPDRPAVTGLALVFPVEWAIRPGAIDQAAVAGEEIQILYRALHVRCPVTVLFTGLEALPGMSEFLRRVATVDPKRLARRLEFEFPSSRAVDHELSQGALDWTAEWFHTHVLALLRADPNDERGNARLARFDYEFRRHRLRLAKVLEVALSPRAQGDEPVRVRGAFFSAGDGRPDSSAFAAGLFFGNAPLLTPGRGGEWTESAVRDDSFYRRLAWALTFLVAAPAASAWLVFVRPTLPHLAWTGLVALALSWVIGLSAPWERWRPTLGFRRDAPD